MFTAFLKSDHYLVRTISKGEDAIRLYRNCAPFEVVLIDYRMPRKSGIDIERLNQFAPANRLYITELGKAFVRACRIDIPSNRAERDSRG
jgi:CheY-like chemotaxis protein